MVSIEAFCPPDVYNPPVYSQGIRVTGAQTILFLSGQVAYDRDGSTLHRGDFKGQAREAFRALKSLIESAGGAMANIVKINTYLTDIRYRADMAPIRQEFFGGKSPASTLVEVSALAHPDWLIEIEAIAEGPVSVLKKAPAGLPGPRFSIGLLHFRKNPALEKIWRSRHDSNMRPTV